MEQNMQEKKRYESPKLVEWGTITEITQGPSTGTTDGNGTGSGGA